MALVLSSPMRRYDVLARSHAAIAQSAWNGHRCSPVVVGRARGSRRSCGVLVAALRVCGQIVYSSGAPLIYVYPLRHCSFDHFAPDDIDGPHVTPLDPERPPALPVHRCIVHGHHVTVDPSNATLFYIPAPFFLWDSSWRQSVTGERRPLDRCFRFVKRIIGSSPWYKKRLGRDHFVLFAGAAYPAILSRAYSSNSDYVFELDWPEFANFQRLTFKEHCDDMLTHDTNANRSLSRSVTCARHLVQSVKIPPLIRGASFHCSDMARRASMPRPIRLAYRGSSSTTEVQSALRVAVGKTLHSLPPWINVSMDFLNNTQERVLAGICDENAAFEGLCPWARVGLSGGEAEAKELMWKEAEETRFAALWSKAEMCLVLPEVTGYEFRLYEVLNAGCIPVIVWTKSTESVAKMPFSTLLPWDEFAFFWKLDVSGGGSAKSRLRNNVVTARQLLEQLIVVNAKVLVRKRAGLLKHSSALGWGQRVSCEGIGSATSALTFAASVLASQVAQEASASGLDFTSRPWFSDSAQGVAAPTVEDVTGSGCPFGYPVCERSNNYVLRGDICRSSITRASMWSCPLLCKRPVISSLSSLRCVEQQGFTACRVQRCLSEGELLSTPRGRRLSSYVLRLAVVAFSDRPALRGLTRPNLERFTKAHGGRYDLLFYDDPILDSRDFHPAWNKLAYARRALVMSSHDAVVIFDDDVLVTDPGRDPIYDAIENNLFRRGSRAVVLASLDDHSDSRSVPFNSGILAFKRCPRTLQVIDEVFRLGRRLRKLNNGYLWLPRIAGLWDQDAFADYINQYGLADFAFVEHGTLQSFVRPEHDRSRWQPGHFAAHVSGVEGDLAERIRLVRRTALRADAARVETLPNGE
eukprot:TRINITY_DN14872_c0_g1_i1.p1 TRINITY_DN14872_c0_g1~~TRINITY_DN14872_c0_g1_i1.p1  ORF type:complete len:864 (+),score=84.44 TRINITY_DN14872_c0_g1_i1:111-2702(+)